MHGKERECTINEITQMVQEMDSLSFGNSRKLISAGIRTKLDEIERIILEFVHFMLSGSDKGKADIDNESLVEAHVEIIEFSLRG